MYAVFQSGSKQYRVIKGQVVNIDRIYTNIEGDKVEFNHVLLIRDNKSFIIGSPFVKKGKVVARIIAQNLDRKIKIVKFHRRKHFHKFQGHRQCFTKIKIIDISGL